jgi:anti-sigma-K factor RskA
MAAKAPSGLVSSRVSSRKNRDSTQSLSHHEGTWSSARFYRVKTETAVLIHGVTNYVVRGLGFAPSAFCAVAA